MSTPESSLHPAQLVDRCVYAAEALRRWRLEAEWLCSTSNIDDPALPIDQRIRRKRQLGALRLVWDELNGVQDVEATGRGLSALADECIGLALGAADAEVSRRFAKPRNAAGEPASLAVMGLGKLGGNELNFNSDVDLVFVHNAVGPSDGARSLSPGEYFGRVIIELSRLLESNTAKGRAWIVDTRLRPYGQAGAMVQSLDWMEHYFVKEGREWERYAWLKARVIAGNRALGQQLIERVQPFVYRRYLDYGLFDSLRDLHQTIDRKGQREDYNQDIKRGPGGIRELEFLIQSLQLLRGGREASLRVSGFLPALRAAEQLELIEPQRAQSTEQDYRFLRKLENCLQLLTGRQTHSLPDDPAAQHTLAWLMGLTDAHTLLANIETVRSRVSVVFHSSFEAQQQAEQGHRLWPVNNLDQQLAPLGFEQPDLASGAIEQLAERVARRGLSAEAQRRLDRLMPLLLDEIIAHHPPDQGLDDILALIETISRRSAYLALLYERPQTLKTMVQVFRQSERIARWVIQNPHLLDDLMDPINGCYLPQLTKLDGADFESDMNALVRFRQAGFVRTALGQLNGSMDRSAARIQLTELAETILKSALDLMLDEGQTRPAIIGYGNLGASALHYASDLDLVFLHPDDDVPLRPVQRLISAMQLPQLGGKLYEVDTRLRPNGNAGMLISSLEGFVHYQQNQAWLWEHQSLIRARCIAGEPAVHDAFDALRTAVLTQARDHQLTRTTMLLMREKQRQSRLDSPEKQLLTDIQFMAELGVLLLAHDHPELIQQRATEHQLKALAELAWLPDQDIERLLNIQAYALSIRDARYLERAYHAPPIESQLSVCARIWSKAFALV
ncbi:MAG: bifunctional [glutamate--ammonia ligase]-adenylyl-L-tyrosine phosphorylase/[glutamate--ammonia-ligase] adenylyltransferase [Pseudomonadota bacterium]